jgi:hypothetical protein
LLLKEFETFLIRRNVSFQQREELMSQYSLDALQSAVGKPTIALLGSSLTRYKNQRARTYVATFANILLFIYHLFEHGVSDVT